MRRFGRLLSLTAALTAIVTLSGCEHKDLCWHHPHTKKVRVVFDWKYAPDAKPEWMNVILYPTDGSANVTQAFTDIKGGYITLLPGQYKAVCFNGDTEAITISDADRFENILFSTRRTEMLTRSFGKRFDLDAPFAEGTENQAVLMEPDMLYADRLTDVTILDIDGEQVITFYPKEKVMDVTVTILNVENLQYCLGESGSISGMASGLYLGQDRLNDDKDIIPMELVRLDGTTLQGKIRSFGHCPAMDGPHKYMLYVILGDGSKYSYEWDVTGQMHDPRQDPMHIKIVLDGVPVPKPITDGGGIKPEVDDWMNEVIDVTM